MKQKNKKIPWHVIVCALFVFIFTNLFSYFIFNHIPRVHDEIDYLFQAKIFKSGRLYVPSPCAKESFDFPHMVNNGKWYSQYTPGYPFLLLLGLLIQAPWLINPILASLSIILFYFLGKEIYNSKVGILAAFMGTISIWFLLMSSTMMSHTSGLFFITFFLYFLFRSIKNPSITNGLLSGIGLGMAFLIRPYNAILISTPFLLYYVVLLIKNIRKRLKNIITFGLAVIFFLSILMIYNQITNGHPLKMGYFASYGVEHSLGFSRTGYTGIPHTPFLGSFKIGISLASLNKYLFGWPISSFLAFLPLLWITKINKENSKKNILLLSGFFSLLIGLYFYWGTHVFIGPRMFFEAIPIFFLLSAYGITEFPRLITLKFKKLNKALAKKVTAGVLIVLITFAFFVRFPSWIWPPYAGWCYDGFANNFAGVTPKIHRTLKTLQLKQSIIILKFLYFPFEYFPDGWWSTGFLYNDPFLSENIIYANDKGDNNIKLLQCFPKRKIFLFLGTLEKGMLVPLKLEGNRIIYGEPVIFDKPGKKYIKLINDPKQFYKIYSTDFGNFLDKIYNQNIYYKTDVARLMEFGFLFKDNKNYKEASFYFEAALQIEKRPEIRYRILSQLASCYFKTGNVDEGKIILERTRDYYKGKYFNIFPKKGF